MRTSCSVPRPLRSRGTMKSTTSPTELSPRNRVTRMFESGRYICFVRVAPAQRTLNRPTRSPSSSAAKTEGESKRGRHSQSMSPSVETRAAVCRSPMTPWSSIAACPVCRVPATARPLQLAPGDQAQGDGPLDELGPLLVLRQVLDVELLEQRPQVGLDRVDAQVELTGDLLVGRRRGEAGGVPVGAAQGGEHLAL